LPEEKEEEFKNYENSSDWKIHCLKSQNKKAVCKNIDF
jgi:hypothetical protein